MRGNQTEWKMDTSHFLSRAQQSVLRTKDKREMQRPFVRKARLCREGIGIHLSTGIP